MSILSRTFRWRRPWWWPRPALTDVFARQIEDALRGGR